VELPTGQSITWIRHLKMSRDRFGFEEEEQDVLLHVKTKVPTKWILLDRETGQTYQGNANGFWDRLGPVVKVDK